MKFYKSKVLVIVLMLYSAGFIKAQTNVSDSDAQSWNDVQLIVPMTGKIDFLTQITNRFGDNFARFIDGRYLFGFVLKPNKSLSITPFYWYVTARSARGLFRDEHQLNLRAVYRFPFKNFGLSHRSQYEYRIRRPQNSWRYRAMLIVDKPIPKNIIPKARFFIQDEVFYDSLIKKFNRNRFMIGITKTLTKKTSVDIYYMRQNDGYARSGDLNVLWTTFKIHL